MLLLVQTLSLDGVKIQLHVPQDIPSNVQTWVDMKLFLIRTYGLSNFQTSNMRPSNLHLNIISQI